MPSKPSAFLEAIIAFLLPYFAPTAANLQDARSEIIDTLASYDTRTRSEMLQAARVIAFGMAALDTLAEVKTAEMSPSLRVRHRGCANGLNRSACLAEKALDRSRARNTIPDSEHAPQSIGTGQPPDPDPHQDRNTRIWAGAMIDTLAQMAHPRHQATARP